jgi:capsular exopolysaccharide synthesis family protein
MAAMSSNKTNKEKSLVEILHIIYRGKTKVILSVFLSLILAFLLNKFSKPVFESSALLKKENPESRKNELYELVRLQTLDHVGTEMELMQTEDVLSRVIDELNLRVEFKEIIDPIGNIYELNNAFSDFLDSEIGYAKQIGFSLPIFKNVELKNKKTEEELYIEKKGENLFELREVKENKLVSSLKTFQEERKDASNINSDSLIAPDNQFEKNIFNVDFAKFEFKWDDAPVGSKIYFSISNYYEFLKEFRKTIYVSGGGGNLFTLYVRSSSPLACKVIANSIISNFRDARMEQQKQSVSYSFEFVDNQLVDIQKKLLNAEDNISRFKSTGKIMTINESTAEIMEYLSTLESEKLQAQILLSDFNDKSDAIREELLSSGFVDQSFLEPTGEFAGSSPFSNLMDHLSELELQRLELLQKRTEKHPDVVNLDEQIRSVKEKLGSYNQNTLTSYQIIIKTLEKKISKINSLMSGYEVKMQQLPEQENRMARLIREKDVYEKIFKLLLDKREEMRVAELSMLQDIIVVDPPNEPFKPIRPRKLMNLLVALFLGGFIGIVLVFIIELKNTRLINLDDLEEEFNIPILALIPLYNKSIVKGIKNSADYKDRFVALKEDNLGIKESYRLLKIKLNHLDIREKTLLITSCEENTGKTSIVANLAVTIAQENKQVLIIDCDLRKADLSNMFDVHRNSPGLIDFITSNVSPTTYTRVMKKIDIIPAGGVREDSSSLLGSDQMKSLFNNIDKSVYDYIIIDTPPVTRVVDTLVLGKYVRNAILVVRPDTSMKESVMGGIQEMRQARIRIHGVVANAAEIQKSYYYRYRYGYGYGYDSSRGNNGKSRRHVIKKDGSILHKMSKVNSS